MNRKLGWRPFIIGGLIVLLTWLVYFPCLRGDFLWDDDDNVTNNQALRSLAGLGQIWFEPGVTQQYYPLTHTSFWLEYHLWGLHPLGYHVINVCCHALSAVLLWQILLRLGVPGAWLGATLFAVHPVCVESVAWITERKNALSGVFFLSALLVSFKFWQPTLSSRANPANVGMVPFDAKAHSFGPLKFYWLAFGLYVCALLSKTATIGLPAVILLLVWWQRRKATWRDIFSVLPFLAVGVGLGMITSWLEKNSGGATGTGWNFSMMERCLIAGNVFWFYLGKLFWPHPLMFMYPRWQTLAYFPILAVVVTMLILWWKRDGWARPLLFTIGYFIVMIFPVMGFFNVYFFRYSFVCDHFQYLAAIAPLALAAAGITLVLSRTPKTVRLLTPAILLLLLGVLACRQTNIYRSRETLWRDSVEHNPDSWLAHNNLGGELFKRGDFKAAAAQYQQALRIDPRSDLTLYNLGIESVSAGNPEAAIGYYRKALEARPDFLEANLGLAHLLDAKGDFPGAVQCYVDAGMADTNSFDAYFNLGIDLLRIGKINEAVGVCRQSVRIAPASAEAHRNLGIALARQGKMEASLDEFHQSLKIDPANADTHYFLGKTLALKGDKAGARDQFTETLRLDPNYADARRKLDASGLPANAPAPLK